MKRAILLSFLAVAVALPAGVPGFGHWTAAALKGYGPKLAAQLKDTKPASEALGDWGNHTASIMLRKADGEAELHEKVTDIFIGQGGEATIKVGGKLLKSRTTGPGEVRGDGIEGGEALILKPGDVVHIPANTPHQVLTKKEFLYFVIKVKQ